MTTNGGDQDVVLRVTRALHALTANVREHMKVPPNSVDDRWLAHQSALVEEHLVALRAEVQRLQTASKRGAESTDGVRQHATVLSAQLRDTVTQQSATAAQNAELSTRLERAMAARDKYKRDCEELQARLARLGGADAAGSGSISARTPRDAISSSAAALVGELQTEVAHLHEQNRRLQERAELVDALESRVIPLQDDLALKAKVEADLRTRVADLEREVAERDEALVNLNKQLSDAQLFQGKHEEALRDIEGLRERQKAAVAELRAQGDEQVRLVEQRVQQRDAQIKRLQDVIASKDVLLEQERSAHVESRKRIREQEDELGVVRTQLRQLASQHHEMLDTSEPRMQRALADLRGELEERHKAELVAQSRTALQRISELQQKLDQIETSRRQETTRLQANLAELQSHADTITETQAPLTHDEDVAAVCARIRTLYDRLPIDRAAPALLGDALKVLEDLASDSVTNRAQVVRFNITPVLVSCMRSSHAPVQQAAAAVVHMIVSEPELEASVAAGTDALCDLLLSSDAETVGHALATLARISASEQVVATAVARGAMKPVTALVSSADSETVRNSLLCLRNLLSASSAKDEFRAHGGVASLMSVLERRVVPEELTLAVFSLLAINPDNRNELRKAGFLPKTVELLRQYSTGPAASGEEAGVVVLSLLNSLVSLSINVHNKAELARFDTLGAVAAVCAATQDVPTRVAGVRVLCNMSMSDDSRGGFAKAEVLQVLLRLAASDAETTKYSVRTLAFLSQSPDVVQAVQRLRGVVEPLLLCLQGKDRDEQLMRDALDALLRIATTEEMKGDIRRARGLVPLLRLYIQSDLKAMWRVKASAAGVLANCVSVGEIRDRVVEEAGLIECVVVSLRADKAELVKHTLSLLHALLSSVSLFPQGRLLAPVRVSHVTLAVVAAKLGTADFDGVALQLAVVRLLLQDDACVREFAAGGGVALLAASLRSVSIKPQLPAAECAAVLACDAATSQAAMELIPALTPLLRSSNDVLKRHCCCVLAEACRVESLIPSIKYDAAAMEGLQVCAMSALDAQTRQHATRALRLLQ